MPPAYLKAPSVLSEQPVFKPGCTGKTGHTRSAAQRTKSRRRDGSYYQCSFCSLWHTTSRNDSKAIGDRMRFARSLEKIAELVRPGDPK